MPWWSGPGGPGGTPGRSYSLLGPRFDGPPLPGAPPSGSGGSQARGAGSGDAGYEKDGQPGIPLNTTDPRYADYFAEIKRRVEAHWVYPEDARRKGQSGQGLVAFVVRKNGSLREVEIVRSSGVDVLDRYLVNAIRFASPLPPIPDRISQDTLPIVVSFTYVLDHGVRVFGLR
jgi:protein TonB